MVKNLKKVLSLNMVMAALTPLLTLLSASAMWEIELAGVRVMWCHVRKCGVTHMCCIYSVEYKRLAVYLVGYMAAALPLYPMLLVIW